MLLKSFLALSPSIQLRNGLYNMSYICKILYTMFDTTNTNVFNMSAMSRKLNDFFQRKVSETTFLNDEDGDFQIHSNEEKTNRHVIDQTCVTYLCESLVVK